MEDWRTYLCFVVGSDGCVVFSPQGTAFNGIQPWNMSMTDSESQSLETAIRNAIETKGHCFVPKWHAQYTDNTTRIYEVHVDGFDSYALVRLYRNEDEQYELTARERDILAGLLDDMTDDELSEAYQIEKSTVRRHLKNLRDKLGVHGRAKLALQAYRLGLVEV